jgi:hypothetical protein
MASIKFPLTVVLIILLGIYTYRHFLIFYPSIVLSLLFFRGGLPWSSRAYLRNIGIICATCALWPKLNQMVGEWIQNRSFENLNAFMTFSQMHWNDWGHFKWEVFFTMNELWPTLFLSGNDDHLRSLAIAAGMMTITGLMYLFVIKIRDFSDIGKVYKLSIVHIVVVFGSVFTTPYANYRMDVRYLIPIYSIVPFLLIAGSNYAKAVPRKWATQAFNTCLGLAFGTFIWNTIWFNNQNGLMSGFSVIKNESIFTDLIQYLRSQKAHCFYAAYPDAYKLALISNEEFTPTSITLTRIRRYEECALQSKPRILALRQNDPSLDSILHRKDTNALQFSVIKKLDPFIVLQSNE